MFSLIYPGLALFAALVHGLLRASARTFRRYLEILLLYLIFFCIGLQGLVAAGLHTFRAPEIASQIGWASGSPFQFEVAMANLGLGIVGILAVKFRGAFWLAISIFNTVYLLGCAYGHLVQEKLGDHAPYNSGVFLWGSDVMAPLVILILSVVYFSKEK